MAKKTTKKKGIAINGVAFTTEEAIFQFYETYRKEMSDANEDISKLKKEIFELKSNYTGSISKIITYLLTPWWRKDGKKLM